MIRCDLDTEEGLFQQAQREGRLMKPSRTLKTFDTYYRELTIYGVRWGRAIDILNELFGELIYTNSYGPNEFEELMTRKSSVGGLKIFRTQSAELESRRGTFLIADKRHSGGEETVSEVRKKLMRAEARNEPVQLSFQKGVYRGRENFITIRSGFVADVDETSVLVRSLLGYRRYKLENVRTVAVGDRNDLDELSVWCYSFKAEREKTHLVERGPRYEDIFNLREKFVNYKG